MDTSTKSKWTEVRVLAPTAIACGGATPTTPGNRARLDLRTYEKAFLKVSIGKTNTTAPAAGVSVKIKRVTAAGVANTGGPAMPPVFSVTGVTTAPVSTTVDSNSAAGQYVLKVAATTSFAVGGLIAVAPNVLTRYEVHRVSAIVSADYLVLDEPLMYAHQAVDADVVTNVAESWGPIEVAGGCYVDVIFDYANSATGSDIIVCCIAQCKTGVITVHP